MTTTVGSVPTEQEISLNQKIIGIIKLARPQFLIAYLIVGTGGIIVGLWQGFSMDATMALYAFFAVILSAVGVHYRDEAGDWAAGYDQHGIGGMGIIREGIFKENQVRLWGRIISSITIILAVVQALFLFFTQNYPILLVVGIPIVIMIIFVNFLTEEIPLGHEIITSGSYLATFYWIYLSQGPQWVITPSLVFFSGFIYLVVFALVPYQDIADLEVDAKTGKRTLASKLGLDGIGHLSIFIGLFSLILLYLALLS
ncbi:MAG: hypothetical protein ACXAC8_02955 [Candidatus Hodarchaeales archaeon]